MRNFIIAVLLTVTAAFLPQIVSLFAAATDGEGWAGFVTFIYGYFTAIVVLFVHAAAALISFIFNRKLLPWAAIANAMLAGGVLQLALAAEPSWVGVAAAVYGLGWLMAIFPRKPAAAAT